MSRQEANKEILKELEKLIDKYPDCRFTQILWNIGIQTYDVGNDTFFEESEKTLNKIKCLESNFTKNC